MAAAEAVTAEQWSSFLYGTVSDGGQICLFNGSTTFRLFSAEGKPVKTIEHSPLAEADHQKGIVKGGKECYIYMVKDGEVSLWPLDMTTGLTGPQQKVSVTEPGESVYVFEGSADSVLLVTMEKLYRYMPETDVLEELLEWTAPYINLSGNYVRAVSQLEDGTVIALADDMITTDTEWYRIEPRDKAELAAKQEITVKALNGISADAAKNMTAEFNKSNDTVLAQVTAYDIHEANGMEKLYQEILTGEETDVLILNGLDIRMLAGKGLLEDLTPWFEKSEKVQKEDLLEGLVEGGTQDGKLVCITPEYGIKGLLISEGCTADDSLTAEEFLQIGLDHPDKGLLYHSNHFFTLRKYVLQTDIESFINWEKQECYFDSERFIQLLEMVKAQQYTQLSDSEEFFTHERFLTGDYLVCDFIISRPEDYADMISSTEGIGKVTGYPNQDEEPHFLLVGGTLLGISSKSQHKKAAWDFIEYFLSEEYQMRNTDVLNRFPARKDAFEERLLQILTYEGVTRGDYMNTFTLELLPLEEQPEVTEAHREAIRYMAEHGRLYIEDTTNQTGDCWDIIFEETEAFFAGDKTAQEAAKIIQNRVMLLLQE